MQAGFVTLDDGEGRDLGRIEKLNRVGEAALLVDVLESLADDFLGVVELELERGG